jgi:protein-tyrosine phosphatase
MLDEAQIPGEWRVESAGTWALVGEAAATGSQTVMSARGIDISKHRAQNVSRELLQSFDLILTMESGHKESLCVEFPDLSDRIYLLSEMVNQKDDIDDPYGGALSEYEQAADEIEGYLNKGFDEIVGMVTS